MFCRSLYLHNFRNIEEQRLEFSDGVNVFMGRNAQGKTNVVEALWLFSGCKSFRPGTDKDFIMLGRNNGGIKNSFIKNGRQIESELRFSGEKRRETFRNGAKIKTGELIGEFNSVLFFPEHLSLIKSGPEERRKFLDNAISQVKPRYYNLLCEYNKILAQRNYMLKSAKKDIRDTVDVWDRKLSRISSLIEITRKSYLEKLSGYAKKIMDDISGGREKIGLDLVSYAYGLENDASEDNLCVPYNASVIGEGRQTAGYGDNSCNSFKANLSAETIEEMCYQKLKASYEEDMRLRYTTVGSHRDDISVTVNSLPAKIYCSQGQQRSCVMAMKLGEAEIINEIIEEYPVMLFDDVFSELDSLRKEYLTEKIKNKQVFITTCEDSGIMKNANIFNVSSGKIEQ